MSRVRIGLLSDIHSNPFALEAVLADARRAGVDELWLLGDTFGYHPWAAETFALIDGAATLALLGNHDVLVRRGSPPADQGVVATLAAHNSDDLARRAPRGLRWLHGLHPIEHAERDGWRITLVHGTPADPLEGRYYPDDPARHTWLPGPGEVVVMGHTHHPLLRGDAARGMLINPGSVGQPRDHNPQASWALLDLGSGTAQLRRSAYDHRRVIERLVARGWPAAVTAALDRSP